MSRSKGKGMSRKRSKGMGNRATSGHLKKVLMGRMIVIVREKGEDEGMGMGDIKGTECFEGRGLG